jgi:hypothetical protein
VRICPFCNSEIPEQAVICRYCGSQLDAASGPAVQARPESQVLTLIMGILGLFCFPFGIVAFVLWLGHRGRVRRGMVRQDGSATAGMVLGLVGFAWQMLFLIAGIYAFFSPAFREPFVAQMMREIHKAQEKHKSSKGEYAAAPAQLKDFGGEPAVETAKWFGYRLEFKASEGEWSCTAIPKDPERYRHFYIDQTGKLRHSKTADIGPHSPEYRPPGFPGD